MHDQPPRARPQHHQIVLATRGVEANGHDIELLQRPYEQSEGLLAAAAGPEILASLEEPRVDRGEGDEFLDLDSVSGLLVQGPELVVGEADVAPLLELVTLDHV